LADDGCRQNRERRRSRLPGRAQSIGAHGSSSGGSLERADSFAVAVAYGLISNVEQYEELRSVMGYSVYPGTYEVGAPPDRWRRYSQLLGVHAPGEIYERLEVRSGRLIGVIHLEQLTELDRPVPLAELRANGVAFAPNIVSGRAALTLEEVAIVVELGGLGASGSIAAAADASEPYDASEPEAG
jgi:hypothetical protein